MGIRKSHVVGVTLAVGVLAAALAVHLVRSALRRTAHEAAREEESQRALAEPPKPPQWTVDLDRQIEADPDGALAALRKAVEDPARREAASERMPRGLSKVFGKRIAEKKYEEAQALQEEIGRTAPEAEEARWVRDQWRSAGREWAWQAVSAGQWDGVERILSALVAGPDPPSFAPGRDALEMYGLHLTGAWTAAFERRDPETARHFIAAAALYARSYQGGALARALADRVNVESLIETGRDLIARGEPAAALAYLQAATLANHAASVTGTPEEEAYYRRKRTADEGIAASKLALARRRANDEFRWLSFDEALNFCSDAASHSRERADFDVRSHAADSRVKWAEQRMEAARVSIALRLAKARLLMEQARHSEAESVLGDVMKVDAPNVLLLRDESPGFDPWAGVPPEVQAEIDKENPGLDEAQRRERLRTMASMGRWAPRLPETEPARALLGSVRTRQGLALLKAKGDDDHERGQDVLRLVLRSDAGGESARQAVDGLRELLRSAGARKDFGALLDHAGFYVAEVGPPGSGDPFRSELKALLGQAAEHFKEQSSMRRLFLLTLMAEAFAGEPEGQSARDEATARAFEIVASSQPQQMSAPPGAIPSGLRGYSVHAIENGTRYHLLLFYDGPERFFVRLNPVRRGSVVLKDGKYLLAAVVTSAEIRPYRGEHTCASEVLPARYTVVQRGGSSQAQPAWDESASVMGSYTLLRAPSGAGPFKVDAASGAVRAGG